MKCADPLTVLETSSPAKILAETKTSVVTGRNYEESRENRVRHGGTSTVDAMFSLFPSCFERYLASTSL